MIKNRIILVEDEKHLGETLQNYLQENNYTCDWATNCKGAVELIKSRELYDIALFDINLPDGSGLELAKDLKASLSSTHLLFLSAQNDPEIKVEGLELGADDFITKPFALKELMLRLKRSGATTLEKQNYSFGSLKIHFDSFEIIDANGKKTNLNFKEAAILKLLIDKSPQVIDRDTIIESVWKADEYPSNRTIDNYIVKLRKWCATDTNKPLEIQSIRGVGYKLLTKD